MEKSSEMRNAIAAVAGPKAWSDTRESWLARAARKAGISFRQCKSLFYGEINETHLAARAMIAAAANQQEKEAKNDLESFAARLGAVESYLLQADPNFHSAEIDRLRGALRQARGGNRTRNN